MSDVIDSERLTTNASSSSSMEFTRKERRGERAGTVPQETAGKLYIRCLTGWCRDCSCMLSRRDGTTPPTTCSRVVPTRRRTRRRGRLGGTDFGKRARDTRAAPVFLPLHDSPHVVGVRGPPRCGAGGEAEICARKKRI